MRTINVVLDDTEAYIAGETMIAMAHFDRCPAGTNEVVARVAALIVAAAVAASHVVEADLSEDTDREILAVHAAKIAGQFPRTSAALVRLLDRSV